MERTYDPAVVEEVINDPSVQGAYEPLPFSLEEFLADRRNVVFAGPGSYIGYHYAAPNTYIGHYAFTAGHRGRAAMQACKETIEVMIDHYQAVSIWACVPLQVKASALLLRRLGFVRVAGCYDHDFYALRRT